MSPVEVLPHYKRKRQLGEARSSLQPSVKRHKGEEHGQHQTPAFFWDNLSRQWLTPRALREFDRRTVWPTVPVPRQRTGKEQIDPAKLKRFARHGGANLDDLRGYPEPDALMPPDRPSDPSQSGSRKRSKTAPASDGLSPTRKTSSYDPAFKQHLIDHGIYPEGYGDEEGLEGPANVQDLNQRFAQPRSSLSPSNFGLPEFRDFRKRNEDALTESRVMSTVVPIITGTADIATQESLLFGNLKTLTDGSIVAAKPDFYDGARPEDLNLQVREDLAPYIVPSTKKNAPCLPNFFIEAKGPDGRAPVSKLQAMYDGALGARAMHELQLYVDQNTAYNKNASTITSTYHSGTGVLALYTTHITPPDHPKSFTRYRMTQLKAFAMTSDPETFRQGAAALRNARDWAQEKRDKLMEAANCKARNPDHLALESSTQTPVSLSSGDLAHPGSETSADDLASNASVVHYL